MVLASRVVPFRLVMAYSVPTGEAPATPPVLDIAVLCDERGRLRWVPELVLGVDLRSLEDPEFRAILARRVRRLQIQVHPDRHSGDGTLSRVVNICATVLRDHGPEYVRWVTRQNGRTAMEVVRAALLLPPPFQDLPSEDRARLAGLVEHLGAQLRSSEATASEERRRAKRAEEQAAAARRAAADAEAARCAQESRARAETERLLERIASLEARVDSQEAALCRQITSAEAAISSAETQAEEARAQILGFEAQIARLTAEVAARPTPQPLLLRRCLEVAAGVRSVNHDVRRTARKLLNKLSL
ncbi:uncharacterized protein LOC122384926 [Amphibalanus amphitrite]|nr:uncharacterized protein LOC122384925 [Amphibalanus amphitrite]XP_043228694.1 uncharacterized protein LOC122384926 [Amphibalanus amphitrite]